MRYKIQRRGWKREAIKTKVKLRVAEVAEDAWRSLKSTATPCPR